MPPLEIFFHFGSSTDNLYLRSALRAHAELLHNLRIAVSREPLAPFMESPAKGAQFISELPPQTRAVCIRAFDSLQDLPAWSAADYATRFPGARLKAFASFPRQDREMEARFIRASFKGGGNAQRWLNAEARKQYYDYAAITSHLERIFGRDNILVSIRGDGPDAAQEAQDAFWSFMGIEVPEAPQASATPPDYPALLADTSLGRDFCECMRQALRVHPVPVKRDSPWARAAATFPRQSAPQHAPLFSPEQRREIRDYWTAANQKLASLLGRDTVFTYPTEEDTRAESAWREYGGLTPESAFAVVGHLEKDFAAELLARFDALPAHNRTYPQRCIHQALQKAVGGASIVVSAPEPAPEPKLSVLTLTYNHASFIRDCMEGAIAQRTNFPIRHIIADDCSDDGAQKIILEYAARYPHIVPVFQTKRSGGRDNVRSMFEMARTEYVALCDGDDYFSDPLKLQTQVDFLDAHKECGLCFHVARVTYEDAPDKERFYPELSSLPRGVRPIYTLVDLLRHNFMQSNTAVYRWRFRNGLPDWFCDNLNPADWYWHLLHAETGPIGFINKTMSVYRRHKNSSYYLAEEDPIGHRCKRGLRELGTYDAINRHFNRKYQSILFDLANGVFAAWLQAADRHAIDIQPLMEGAAEKFPDFSRNFLDSLAL